MVMIYETLILAIATLVGPLFGRMAGCELHHRPFGLITASGLFFLLSVAFAVSPVGATFFSSIWYGLSVISYFIGWISLAIGAIWQLLDVTRAHPAGAHS